MLITKFIEIDVGHRIPNHKSKCRNFHGHRYKIVVGVNDKVIARVGDSSEGMVIDFSDLKAIMMREIDEVFDHGFMIWENDKCIEFFMTQMMEEGMKVIKLPFIPTAENFVRHLYVVMEHQLKLKEIKIEYVEVYETPTSTAKYSRKDDEEDEYKY